MTVVPPPRATAAPGQPTLSSASLEAVARKVSSTTSLSSSWSGGGGRDEGKKTSTNRSSSVGSGSAEITRSTVRTSSDESGTHSAAENVHESSTSSHEGPPSAISCEQPQTAVRLVTPPWPKFVESPLRPFTREVVAAAQPANIGERFSSQRAGGGNNSSLLRGARVGEEAAKVASLQPKRPKTTTQKAAPTIHLSSAVEEEATHLLRGPLLAGISIRRCGYLQHYAGCHDTNGQQNLCKQSMGRELYILPNNVHTFLSKLFQLYCDDEDGKLSKEDFAAMLYDAGLLTRERAPLPTQGFEETYRKSGLQPGPKELKRWMKTVTKRSTLTAAQQKVVDGSFVPCADVAASGAASLKADFTGWLRVLHRYARLRFRKLANDEQALNTLVVHLARSGVLQPTSAFGDPRTVDRDVTAVPSTCDNSTTPAPPVPQQDRGSHAVPDTVNAGVQNVLNTQDEELQTPRAPTLESSSDAGTAALHLEKRSPLDREQRRESSLDLSVENEPVEAPIVAKKLPLKFSVKSSSKAVNKVRNPVPAIPVKRKPLSLLNIIGSHQPPLETLSTRTMTSQDGEMAALSDMSSEGAAELNERAWLKRQVYRVFSAFARKDVLLEDKLGFPLLSPAALKDLTIRSGLFDRFGPRVLCEAASASFDRDSPFLDWLDFLDMLRFLALVQNPDQEADQSLPEMAQEGMWNIARDHLAPLAVDLTVNVGSDGDPTVDDQKNNVYRRQDSSQSHPDEIHVSPLLTDNLNFADVQSMVQVVGQLSHHFQNAEMSTLSRACSSDDSYSTSSKSSCSSDCSYSVRTLSRESCSESDAEADAQKVKRLLSRDGYRFNDRLPRGRNDGNKLERELDLMSDQDEQHTVEGWIYPTPTLRTLGSEMQPIGTPRFG